MYTLTSPLQMDYRARGAFFDPYPDTASYAAGVRDDDHDCNRVRATRSVTVAQRGHASPAEFASSTRSAKVIDQTVSKPGCIERWPSLQQR